MSSFRELTGNLKKCDDLTTEIAKNGTLHVDMDHHQLILHDGLTPGGIVLVSSDQESDLATKQYVDETVAAMNLYQGVWQVAANIPDLTSVVRLDNYSWIAQTVDPNIPETASAALPGIGGDTIDAGDSVRWNAELEVFDRIRGSSMSITEARGLFIDTAGDAMTGQLKLINPVGATDAVHKGYVDAQIAALRATVVALTAVVNTNALTHDVKVSTVSATLNNAVVNGGILYFDTVNTDSNGYAPITVTFDHVKIPTGLAGIYVITGWSSSSGTQATTMGMGILINGSLLYSGTNQSITGPGSLTYTLDNAAVEIVHLNDGDIVQLVNNSVSTGTNVFLSTEMSLVRIGPGTKA
jgi:hypothetical protein